MATRKQYIKDRTNLQCLEDISRKLASPGGMALNHEEALMMRSLRCKETNTIHLRALDQFFANGLINP
jgi:hypothetical protein